MYTGTHARPYHVSRALSGAYENGTILMRRGGDGNKDASEGSMNELALT